MRGFVVTALALTFLEVLLEGRTSGRGGNVTGLLGVPAAVGRRLLDPQEPFFRRPARAVGGAQPSSARTPA